MKIHPLEPLSAAEVQAAVSLLKTIPSFDTTTRIISIMLKEPAKELVHAWRSGPAAERRASAVLLDNASNSVSTIDLNLTGNAVAGLRPAPAGAQPTLSIDEQIECEQAVLSSPAFRAALEKHYGITDTSLVMVDIWSAGYYGQEEERTRRMTRPLCFLRCDPTDNGSARPIEGIRPVVDLNAMQFIRIEEYGHWPLPPEPGNYAATRVQDFRTDIKSLTINQPDIRWLEAFDRASSHRRSI